MFKKEGRAVNYIQKHIKLYSNIPFCTRRVDRVFYKSHKRTSGDSVTTQIVLYMPVRNSKTKTNRNNETKTILVQSLKLYGRIWK